ncbi:MAG: SH3 domain-containing protein [Chloroflexota bacterium]|nr:SH3 domain-containing protein [Chloroflexota bacterium]
MQTTQSLRVLGRLAAGAVFSAFVLVLSACQPIVDPALLESQQPAAAEEAAQPAPVIDVEPAKATVNTRSLRVRQGPGESFEQIGSIREGETYDVLGMSSDGAWIQVAVEELEGGSGWVSTELVILEGDITNIPTVEAEAAPVAEATPEPAEEAAPEATEEPAEEAAPEATEEPAEEAAPEATEEPAEEAAPEATEEPADEAVTPPPAGYALIQAVPPLRVRSAPTADEDNKVGNVFDGEIYRVLEVSEDGLWVKIDVPELELEDGGWVSAEFVILGE